MQVKKEDLKDIIIETAREEFIKKGYENSSMRVIAKKANTALGNIYTYFDNKETILVTILEPIMKDLDTLVTNHLEQSINVYTTNDLEIAFEDIEMGLTSGDFQYIMHRELLILLDLKTTSYVQRREDFLDKCKQHFAWHLRLEDKDSYYLEVLVNTFIECTRHVLKEQKNSSQAKEEYLKLFKMICTGFVVNKEK